MKKKILYIVEAMGGGVFTYIVDLANELVEEYDMYVAYAVRPQTPTDYVNYFDKRVHLIKVKHFTRNVGKEDIKAFFEIKKITKDINPDIIHLHSSKAGAIGRWAFNGRNYSLFNNTHGYSFLMSNHSKKKRILYKTIEKLSAKRKCKTISCSIGEHKETLKLTRNATYVNNGINTDQLDDMLKDINRYEHPLTVFTLGRICYQKNPELFNKIAMSMPDIKFVWIGDGEMRNVLTSPNIEVTGWADRHVALKYAVNADIFLLTSLWEGLPMSLLEAMYMKKVCVVSNAIGNRDVIKNGFNGYVCNSIKDYKNAIKINDKLAENAHKDVCSLYNTHVMAQKYKEIYGEC